jgi:hypothetical protein
VLEFGIKKQDGGTFAQPVFTSVGEDRVIGRALWLGDEPGERYEVLTIRDGKIVDMQGCRTKREAERFARRD